MGHPIAQPHINAAVTPFEETAAYRRYGAEVMPEPDAPEEPYTRALVEEQGFDGLPQVVSSRQLDAYVRAGEIEVFRGVSDPLYATALRYGRFFVGRGSYGSGMYAVGGIEGLGRARHYSGHGVVLRMTLKPGVRLAVHDDLLEAAYHARENAIRRIRAEEEATRRLTTEVERRHSKSHYDRLVETEHAKYDDLGRYGAYLGFDGLHIGEREYYVLLNRSAVRVQREDLR